MAARNRLAREYRELQRTRDPEITLTLDGESFEHWTGLIAGPPDSPFAGFNYKLAITCDSSYPLTPPTFRFVTKVFHPNVHFETGEICLDILKAEHWSPAWSLLSACRAVISLLASPNADSPLNCDAGNLLRCGDEVGLASLAKYYAVEYAEK